MGFWDLEDYIPAWSTEPQQRNKSPKKGLCGVAEWTTRRPSSEHFRHRLLRELHAKTKETNNP